MLVTGVDPLEDNSEYSSFDEYIFGHFDLKCFIPSRARCLCCTRQREREKKHLELHSAGVLSPLINCVSLWSN